MIDPDGILIEVWKCLKKAGIPRLTKLFNVILRSEKCQTIRQSTLVTIKKTSAIVRAV